MPEIIFYVEYLVFLILCFGALLFCREKHSGHLFWRLKPSVVFIASFILYTSAMPLSRILGLSAIMPDDVEYLLAHVLAATGLLFGSYFGRGEYQPVFHYPLITRETKIAVMLMALFASGLLIWRTLHFVGYSPVNLMERYRFEQDILESSGSTWDKLLVHLLSSTCVFGLYLLGWGKNNARYRAPLLWALAAGALLLLVRGNRNPVIMVLLPVIGLMLKNRPIPVMKAVLTIITVYSLFQTIAIIRNVGFRNRQEVDVQFVYYDPLRSEFGTSYNVWMAAKDTPFFYERSWGVSIFWNSLVNLVPVDVWPNRPQTAAGELSFYYFEKGGNEVFGLGYSPVLEALLNFSLLGVGPWFLILILVIRKFEHFVENRGAWGTCSWAALLPIMVNAQRIDAAVAIKLYLIFILLFIIYDRSLLHQVLWMRIPKRL